MATDVGGIPEITNPDCSILTEAEKTPPLIDALRTALNRKWDRPAISARLTRTWDDVAKETYAVCEEVALPSRAPSVRRSRRPRITVVSSYFPQTTNPYRGHSAYQTLLAMQPMAEIQVISPRAAYPFEHNIPYSDRQYGELPVRYVGYPAIPGLTRAVNSNT